MSFSLLSKISALPERAVPTGPVCDDEKKVVFAEANLNFYKKRGVMVEYAAPLFGANPDFAGVFVDKIRLEGEAYVPGAESKYPLGPRSVFFSAKIYKLILADAPARTDIARKVNEWLGYVPLPVDVITAGELTEKGARKLAFTLHFSASAQKSLAEFLDGKSEGEISSPASSSMTLVHPAVPATFIETTPFSPARATGPLSQLSNTRR